MCVSGKRNEWIEIRKHGLNLKERGREESARKREREREREEGKKER